MLEIDFKDGKRALMHNANDDVCVVVSDVLAGDRVQVTCIEDGSTSTLLPAEDIPANFKVALKDVPVGGEVHEYGEVIGVATKPIEIGDCVHILNIKTTRF